MDKMYTETRVSCGTTVDSVNYNFNFNCFCCDDEYRNNNVKVSINKDVPVFDLDILFNNDFSSIVVDINKDNAYKECFDIKRYFV